MSKKEIKSRKKCGADGGIRGTIVKGGLVFLESVQP
jgi:hypothetical protein